MSAIDIGDINVAEVSAIDIGDIGAAEVSDSGGRTSSSRLSTRAERLRITL